MPLEIDQKEYFENMLRETALYLAEQLWYFV